VFESLIYQKFVHGIVVQVRHSRGFFTQLGIMKSLGSPLKHFYRSEDEMCIARSATWAQATV
jgi:hypothetical protein